MTQSHIIGNFNKDLLPRRTCQICGQKKSLADFPLEASLRNKCQACLEARGENKETRNP